MNIEKFKNKLYKYISLIENELDTMPYKGDRCQTSQKVCLQQAIYNFEKNVNGIEEDDLIPNKEDE